MKPMKKVLSLILALVMVLSLVPYTVFGADMTTITKNQSVPLDTSRFYTIFHLDCGRNYFSVQQIKNIIDECAKDGYNTLELAVGNDALRLLLDDMSVTANGTTYDSTTITNAVKSGNGKYRNNGTNELTQDEMDTIIAYAKSKGVSILPLINAPGHANTMLAVMKAVGISNPAYDSDPRTIDVRNAEAVNFSLALVNKYIQYFAGKGCKIFNMGADEYANTSYDSGSMGFGHLQSAGEYGYYANYVNNMAAQIQNAGMTAMAFNDGIYFNNNTSATFDSDIAIAYWTSGWRNYTPMSAANLAAKGHKIINTNDGWYYVVGRTTQGYGYDSALNAAKNTKVTDIPGSNDPTASGAMMCLWYDESATYDESKVKTLLSTLAENNPDYFQPDKTVWNQGNTVSVTGPGLTSVTVNKLNPASYKPENAIVVGYDITPYVGNTQYTDGGKVTITIPSELANCSSVKVYDVKEQKILESSVSDNVITFTASHFSEYDLVGASASTDTGLVEKTIDLTVGETKTDVQDGSFPGAYPTADTSIATASVTTGTADGTPGTDPKTTKVTNVSTGEYILGNGSQWIVLNAGGTIGFTTDASQATKWTVTKNGTSYTIKFGDYYLSKNTETAEDWNSSSVWYSNVYNRSNYYYKDGDNYYQVTCTRSGSWSQGYKYTITYKDGNGTTQTLVSNKSDARISTLYTKSSTTSNVLGTSASSYSWSFSPDYGFGDGTTRSSNYIRYNNGWTLGSRDANADAFPYTYTPGTDSIPGGPITTASFTGVSEGTTTVKIGNVLYTINVTDRAPTGAMTSSSLTLEYWITNIKVYKGNSTSTASTATIPSSAASSNDGVAITDYAPEQAYSFFDGTVTVYYWQAMRLDANNKQTDEANDDEIADGTSFTHVRYHGGAWQYKTTDGVWHYFLSTDQAVAYYLQKTDITKEVITYMKDWGYDTASTTPDHSSGKGQAALTVAVVYPDGTVSPTEANMYSQATTIFNYNSNWGGSGHARDIGLIAPVSDNSDYEIEKITYTYGRRTDNTAANTWSANATIAWNKTTNAAGTQWYDETETWNDTMGTAPMVNGATSQIYFQGKNTGVLILIYLKPVHHDTNLTVKWVDDTDHADITSQEIVVDYTGHTAPTFLTHIVNNGSTGAPAGNINLSDTAYIVNKAGVHQTFNKDLTVMTNIPGKYTSGLYDYVSADISDDGKTLTLHYTLDSSKLDHNYVVDFGLPVNISLSDLGITNDANISKVTTTKNAVYDSARKTITCTPSAVMSGIETVSVTVEYNDSTAPHTFSIGFIPATTVNYEEGFAKLTGFNGGTKSNTAQTTQKAGQSTDAYGYDTAAAGLTNYVATSNTKGSTATVDFTGTGIDLYVKSTANSGNVMVLIYNTSTNKVAKIASVKTTSYSTITDSYSNSDQAGLIAVSVTGLEHGSYTAKMTTTTADPVYFDGFRIYGTLPDQANDYYTADKEDNPTFLELRDYVLTAMDVENESSADVYAQIRGKSSNQNDEGLSANAVVLNYNSSEDSDDEALLKNGPKNELFLLPGEQVVFNLNTNRVVQVGLKAVNGDVTVSGSVNKTISTSTDMFYTVTKNDQSTITIKNSSTSNGILSVTKVKICDDPNVSFAELTEADIAYAMSVGSAPVEPETPEVTYADAALKVSLVDYTGKVISSTSLTANGVAGETAEFSAEDIRSAAQGALAAGYGFVDLNSVNGASVVYGEDGSVQIQVGKVATLQITYKRLGKVVGTATLTHVQTSGSAKTTFTTQEIKGAAPSGRSVISILGTSVKFGSTSKINATTL